MKLLIAEDSVSALKLIERLVSAEGYEYESYQDGKSAFDALQQPDAAQILILDWMMPEMSGLEIVQKLVEQGLKDDKYIIILSAKDSKEEIAKILRAGADDYVTKPMSREEFVARLKVAERAINYHTELRAKTEELEALVRKHNLLNSLTTSPLAFDEENGEPLPHSYLRHDADSPAVTKALRIDAVSYFDRVILPTCAKLGLELEVETPAEDWPYLEQPTVVAWMPVIVGSMDLWLDFIIDLPLDTAHGIASEVLKARNLAKSHILDLFGEAIAMAQASFSSHLLGNDIETVTPFVSRALTVEDIGGLFETSRERLSWRFQLEGKPAVRASVLIHNAPVNQRIFRNLRPLEILAADIAPTERPETILMKRWQVLTRSNMKYIERWVSFNTITDAINTVSPSLFAQKLILNRAERETVS